MYVAELQGALQEHPLEDLTMPEALLTPAVISMTGQQRAKFLHRMEVHVEYFIQLAQTDNEEAL